jgi:hypothetical protein
VKILYYYFPTEKYDTIYLVMEFKLTLHIL